MTRYVIIVIFLFCINIVFSQIPDCVKCCCSNIVEVGIPNGNFQDPPFANPLLVYYVGQKYSNWTVTKGSIDVKGPNYLNWALGNPNGASQFVDLNGTTPGSMFTVLNGLKVGYKYTIVLWYAKNAATVSADCQVKVAGGAWLDETFTATNDAINGWLKKCFTFTALSTSAELSFTGYGTVNNAGVLLDDITMYSCAPKSLPVFVNPPPDVTGISCLSEMPTLPVLVVQDDCDNNPAISLQVDTTGSLCNKVVSRTWTAMNKCGGISSTTQKIFIEDKLPPVFNSLPVDKYVNCTPTTPNQFDEWLSSFGGAVATDNCSGNLKWEVNYIKNSEFPCGEINVDFKVTDDCGNMVTQSARFIAEDIDVADSTAKIFIPNVFSPNLDGKNEKFTIFGNQHLIRIKELDIYSRWGELIYSVKDIEPNNPEVGWDGTARGKLLNPGVFVYWAIIELDTGKTKFYKGDITLLR